MGEISRRDLRKKFRDASYRIPGGGTFGRSDRVKLEKELFSDKYGSHISGKEWNLKERKLKKNLLNAKKSSEKTKIRRKIRFLKNIRKDVNV